MRGLMYYKPRAVEERERETVCTLAFGGPIMSSQANKRRLHMIHASDAGHDQGTRLGKIHNPQGSSNNSTHAVAGYEDINLRYDQRVYR